MTDRSGHIKTRAALSWSIAKTRATERRHEETAEPPRVRRQPRKAVIDSYLLSQSTKKRASSFLFSCVASRSDADEDLELFSFDRILDGGNEQEKRQNFYP